MNASIRPDDETLEALVGFNAELGFRLVEWEEGRAVMALDIQAKHRNRSGVLHGGVMATLIDLSLIHISEPTRPY